MQPTGGRFRQQVVVPGNVPAQEVKQPFDFTSLTDFGGRHEFSWAWGSQFAVS
jgi:hypothetical protein